ANQRRSLTRVECIDQRERETVEEGQQDQRLAMFEQRDMLLDLAEFTFANLQSVIEEGILTVEFVAELFGWQRREGQAEFVGWIRRRRRESAQCGKGGPTIVPAEEKFKVIAG